MATARADPEVPQPPDDLVGGFVGMRLPGPGTIGTMTVGRLQPWFIAVTGFQGGLRVGRLAFLGEGEIDAPANQQQMMMIRGGADVRLSLVRGRTAWAWSRRGNWERRTAYDVFVEGGAGEQWLPAPGMPTVTRPDLELGAGAAIGGSRHTHATRDAEVYLRVRVLVAPSPTDPAVARGAGACTEPSPSGRDLGVFVDFALTYGS